MKVAELDSYPVEIPLDEPVSFSKRVVEERDHAIVNIKTDSGIEGIGYTLGYECSDIIADLVEKILKPIVIDEDPNETERLWDEMFNETIQVGRKGLVLRAISIVDIALWDIKAKAADMPLYKLLGGSEKSIPAYASGGYYRENKGISGLRSELERYIDEGHDTVKIKVGGESPEKDIERVKTAREVIGEDRTLLLDANGKWENKQDAISICREFGEYNPYFIEEPIMPDSIRLMSKVNSELSYPVAAGELEYTRYGFDNLLRENAVDIVQPDVTVVGGVTEWMKVAHAASMQDISVAPHYNWDLHIQLLAAIENGLWAEYFYRDMDVTVFDDVLEHPLQPNNGEIDLPDRNGHGVVLDPEKVRKFRP